MKKISFVLFALALGGVFPTMQGLAANEFILLDTDKKKTSLPSTDEYASFKPGLMMSDENVSSSVEQDNGSDVKIIIEDESGEKIATLETLISRYQSGEYDGLQEPLQNLSASGNVQASEMLGVMYYGGKGVERNAAKAFEYLNKAAENNSVIAQHHLGAMYFTGEGTIADPVKSLMWLHIAIAHYPEGAEKKRATEDRDNVFVRLTRREKERALEMAQEWLSQRGEAHLLTFQ